MRAFRLGALSLIFLSLLGCTTTANSNSATDLSIEVVSLTPPSGSTLKATEPVTVRMKYNYQTPKGEIGIWAKGRTDSSIYEPSSGITAGQGEITRYVYLTEPGELTAIDIVAKDSQYREIYNEAIAVDYTYIENDEIDPEDGFGSKITDIHLSIAPDSTLKAGQKVYVDVSYEIDSTEGLNLWVIPDTECEMTYEGSPVKQNGQSTVRKYFLVAESCEVKQLGVMMQNASGQLIDGAFLDVDLKFVD